MSRIPFLLDEEAYRKGRKRWIGMDYKSGSPHCLIAGRSGSGKTVTAKLLLAKSILYAEPVQQPVEIIVIDPKSDNDFDFLQDLPALFRGDNSPQGLNYAFDKFKRRQLREDESRNLVIVFIDEFASLVNFVESKQGKEEIFRKLSLLLMLSRSYQFSIQLATQQPNAQTLGNSGNREQMGLICLLSDSSGESLRMCFDSDSVEKIREFGHIGSRAVGWISRNGGIAQPVRTPQVNNWNKLHAVIKKGVERGSP